MMMNKKELLGSLELQLSHATTELEAPFFEIATKAGNKWTTRYTSKPQQQASNPCWEPLTLALDQITKNGSLDSPIRITVKDSSTGGAVDRWIGSLQTTIQELVSDGEHAFPIKQQEFFTSNCGMIVVQNAKIAATS
mmetsp:Transcript_28183/g.39649  ORF Transcript_28183/g.39649 Transcript_28183/m.39649 type:complete len:137 (-) Transcript_28183:289-699(-)